VVNSIAWAATNAKVNAGALALDTIVAEKCEPAHGCLGEGRPQAPSRYMPPAGLPRPDERTYDAVVASLENFS